MNERIKKIAQEAGFIFWDDCSWKPKGAVIDWASDYDQEFAKFTELIIAECCVALHPMLRDMISRTQGVDLIVKHFGVE